MKHSGLLILVLFVLINTVKAQDTLKLKNRDTLLVDVVQMDKFLVFFIDRNNPSGNIISMNWDSIESLHLFGNDIAPKDDYVVIATDTVSGFNKYPVGLSLDILPGLGGSFNFDATEDINISIGAGLLYFKFGSKFYITKTKNTKRHFIDTNIYNFYLTGKNYLNINYGMESRKKHGLNIVFEGGLFISSNIVFPMVSIGIGTRF